MVWKLIPLEDNKQQTKVSPAASKNPVKMSSLQGRVSNSATCGMKKLPLIVVTGECRTTLTVRDLLKNNNIKKFCVKASKQGVFIYAETEEEYNKIIKFLRTKKVEFYTYAPRGSKRNRKFLLIGLDVTENISLIEDIVYSISGVLDVRRLSKADIEGIKKEISPILVSTMPWTKLEELKEKLTSINGVPLKVVPFHGNNEIVQCFRCQKFGHTRNYCDRNVACVRCSGPHDIKACPRATHPPKCANCSEGHVASFRKCIKRIEAEETFQQHKLRTHSG